MSESEKELEPLSPLARALMGAERRPPDLSAEVTRRLLGRVTASIAVDLAIAAGVRHASPPVATGARAIFTLKAIGVLGATFVAGAVAGFEIRGESSRPPTTVAAPLVPMSSATPVLSNAFAEPSATASASLGAASATRPDRTPPVATGSAAPSPRTSSISRDSSLAAERVLVEQARMAVARGDSSAALDAVRQHAHEFPAGRLGEEREALAVQALVQAGRLDEARARSALFQTTFPTSIFLPAVRAAVLDPGSIPPTRSQSPR